MTPKEFFQQIDLLVGEKNWQGVVDWCEAQYPQVEALLSEEERDEVEGAVLETAHLILEGERRASTLPPDSTPARELATVA
jgi:hypothetical protein